jgi:MFS family permease
MLVFFRVLQGIGGGALQPLSQAILLESFPPKEHGIAMAIFGIGIMFGPIMGPLMGGYITDTWSWRWIFYVNLPIGLLAAFMVMLFIRDPHYLKRTEKVKVDLWGIALLTVGIGALQIVLDKGQREDWFQSDFILALTAVAVLVLALFVIVELYIAEHPIVDLRAFRNVSFGTGNVVMFIAFSNLFGSIVLLPLYAQILLGYTATLAGLVLSPGGVATLLVMPIVGKLIGRQNPKYVLTFGIVVCAFSTWAMSRFSLGADFSSLMWPRIYLGIGMGCLFIPLTTLTLSSIPRPQMGNATSIYNLLRNLGGSFGVAFVTTMFVRRAQVPRPTGGAPHRVRPEVHDRPGGRKGIPPAAGGPRGGRRAHRPQEDLRRIDPPGDGPGLQRHLLHPLRPHGVRTAADPPPPASGTPGRGPGRWGGTLLANWAGTLLNAKLDFTRNVPGGNVPRVARSIAQQYRFRYNGKRNGLSSVHS